MRIANAFAAQRKMVYLIYPARGSSDILQETIVSLTRVGYQFISMDHFARP